jgi:two-component system response regulator AdeR
MNNSLVLVAEDEPEISEIIVSYLERAGFRTVRAIDGAITLDLFRQLEPDMVLLDINMPKRDGIEVLREIRKFSDTPVIMVTAMTEDIEKISALRLGADDYVLKPFNPLEVVERIKAVLRRTNGQVSGVRSIRVGVLEIDFNSHAVFVCAENSKRHIALTQTEFLLISHMSPMPKRAYNRSELVDACLPEGDALERTIDSHISNARKKLQQAGVAGFLETIRGVGYRLEPLS